MLCLGINGGLNRIYDDPYVNLPATLTHDGAAALVADGRVVAAIEEERLNRIKHSNKFPLRAIEFCLRSAGACLEDVDRIAFYMTEAYSDMFLKNLYLTDRGMQAELTARATIGNLLAEAYGKAIDPDRLVFVRHHVAHALSATAMSGFDESLVLVIDGFGDTNSGLIGLGSGSTLKEIGTFPIKDSLGHFYLNVIQFLGYSLFDEYKVMGLAPYGDAARYRSLLRMFYKLRPNGAYEVYLDRIVPMLLGQLKVRRSGEPFDRQHKDLAASLQEALEEIVLHVLRWHKEKTGLKNLCLAGGVAHNCSMNGRLLYSGLFDRIFVQPAAHDAGCALGAALYASQESGFPTPREPLHHVFWGTDAGTQVEIEQELNRWSSFIEVEVVSDIEKRAAELIAKDAVIGWVQGRSEFGPRALGNRSILADPRPAHNKERINAMVKKRESYRPFAPSVLEEDAREFFDLPEKEPAYEFMIFVVKVREDKRETLGAVTHVDGTARIHTVSESVNPRYWKVIKAFKDLTGVPVLLNTSFNNNVEPIVDSVEDAVVSFLTTGLDYLVVGNCLVRKREVDWRDWQPTMISLPAYARIHHSKIFIDEHSTENVFEVGTSVNRQARTKISQTLCTALISLDGEQKIGDLIRNGRVPPAHQNAFVAEILELWSRRLVQLRPCPTSEKLDRINTLHWTKANL